MISAPRRNLQVLLYEGDGSQPLESEQRFDVMQALLERGYAVRTVRSGDRLHALSGDESVVLARYCDGRAPQVAAQDSASPLRTCDIDGLDGAAVLEAIEAASAEAKKELPGGWKPWFPVIDFDRCTNCMQCLSFCLFDVYGVNTNGEIQVQNESNCKTDCPACSRVCPEVAILFPKYKAGPINGDEISEDDLRREAMKVDISALLGGDIYSMLRDRSEKAKSRFSKERDDERALKERQRCLNKLQKEFQDMEIPPEVMASLPSADQIQQKAAEAKARAEAALSQNDSDTTSPAS